MKRRFNSDQYMCCMNYTACPMNVNNNYCVAQECQYMVLDHTIADECFKKQIKEELELNESRRAYP